MAWVRNTLASKTQGRETGTIVCVALYKQNFVKPQFNAEDA